VDSSRRRFGQESTLKIGFYERKDAWYSTEGPRIRDWISGEHQRPASLRGISWNDLKNQKHYNTVTTLSTEGRGLKYCYEAGGGVHQNRKRYVILSVGNNVLDPEMTPQHSQLCDGKQSPAKTWKWQSAWKRRKYSGIRLRSSIGGLHRTIMNILVKLLRFHEARWFLTQPEQKESE
jgi:hypothetical protein